MDSNAKAASSDIVTQNVFANEEDRVKQAEAQRLLEVERVKLAADLVAKEKELKDAQDETLKSQKAILDSQNKLQTTAISRLMKAQAGETDAMGRPTRRAVAAKKQLADIEDAQKQDAFLSKWNANLDKMTGLSPEQRAAKEAEGARIGASVVQAERAAIDESKQQSTNLTIVHKHYRVK